MNPPFAKKITGLFRRFIRRVYPQKNFLGPKPFFQEPGLEQEVSKNNVEGIP